ncbi:Uma2 family endonuclease [Hymenobacter sp. UV11]|uniref:Uma2 family endonuclease n=1 Tax=Hymenobacter sp. UV11 TaxID=1849735 RepID=UPI00105D0931|nr:Uma2 family endonuclease [Hymenobacter sp. UV11]TDN35913.1 hypothetical protein A8B98_10865 [Hymenobacter sp. UV11]TFZ68279.1 Uma2 family endonuclease [Hymenobacter sp. UV11]
MVPADVQPRRYTAEEYFALEVKSEVRHDFFEGQIIKRPGDTATHNTIVGNCMMALRQALRHSESQVYTLGILLVVSENEHYTYPNLLVCCADDGAGEIALIRQPQLLLQVSYPETEADDHGLKFNQYKKLPSLRHYVLVAQPTWRVEWYRRNEANEWVIVVLTEPNEVLAIQELNLSLTVAQVYEETGVAQLCVKPQELERAPEPDVSLSEE